MSKVIGLISLSFCLILSAFRLFPSLEPPGYSWFNLDPAELARKTKYLDDQIRARHSFLAIEYEILERLGRGQLSLPQACDQLYQRAREVYPRSLASLRKATGNMPLKEKMAHGLVEHFRFEAENTPSFCEVVARLQQELSSKPFRDWGRQPWVEEPAHP